MSRAVEVVEEGDAERRGEAIVGEPGGPHVVVAGHDPEVVLRDEHRGRGVAQSPVHLERRLGEVEAEQVDVGHGAVGGRRGHVSS
jgi:hypothetical protein